MHGLVGGCTIYGFRHTFLCMLKVACSYTCFVHAWECLLLLHIILSGSVCAFNADFHFFWGTW